MKNAKKIFLSVLLIIIYTSSAQNVSDLNSTPTVDTSSKTEIRYYYFPNIEAYFDLQEKVYLYKDNGEWTEAEELPKNYGGYSIYNKARVNINDYDGDEPYLLLADHKKMYPYNSKGRFANQTASND